MLVEARFHSYGVAIDESGILLAVSIAPWNSLLFIIVYQVMKLFPLAVLVLLSKRQNTLSRTIPVCGIAPRRSCDALITTLFILDAIKRRIMDPVRGYIPVNVNQWMVAHASVAKKQKCEERFLTIRFGDTRQATTTRRCAVSESSHLLPQQSSKN